MRKYTGSDSNLDFTGILRNNPFLNHSSKSRVYSDKKVTIFISSFRELLFFQAFTITNIVLVPRLTSLKNLKQDQNTTEILHR